MEPAAASNLHPGYHHDHQHQEQQFTAYNYSSSSSLLYPNDHLMTQNSTTYDLNMCSDVDDMGGGRVVSSRQGLMSSYGGGEDDDGVLLQQYSSNFPHKLISNDQMILHNPNDNGLDESSPYQENHQYQQLHEFGAAGCFSRILPSINISSSSPPTSNYNSNSGSDLCFFPHLVSNSTSSLDLNLQTTYGYNHDHEVGSTNSSQSSQNENTILAHHHLMQQELRMIDSHSNSSNNHSFEYGVCKIKKRPNISISKTKNNVVGGGGAEAKKQRPAPQHISYPPLKVRKEKLGDRIATLQRLVAPYGKTDTASVLTEAIGYIQFLHDQVQTLSVPYGLNKPTRTVHEEHKSGQEKKDLRSRGLCLVSSSSASFLHGYNNGI